MDCEVSDPATGEVLAIAEACWPEGLQPGQSDPVILELDPAEADLSRIEEIGYEVFTSIESLRRYVHRRNQGLLVRWTHNREGAACAGGSSCWSSAGSVDGGLDIGQPLSLAVGHSATSSGSTRTRTAGAPTAAKLVSELMIWSLALDRSAHSRAYGTTVGIRPGCRARGAFMSSGGE